MDTLDVASNISQDLLNHRFFSQMETYDVDVASNISQALLNHRFLSQTEIYDVDAHSQHPPGLTTTPPTVAPALYRLKLKL
jgi:hypothetical protein